MALVLVRSDLQTWLKVVTYIVLRNDCYRSTEKTDDIYQVKLGDGHGYYLNIDS